MMNNTPLVAEHDCFAVAPDSFIAAAELVAAYDRNGGHDLAQVERVLDAHPSGNLVQVLVQQLATAIRSPKFDVQEWAQVEIDRTVAAMRDDVEIDIIEKDAELESLGIPEQYRARVRAWAAGAPLVEIEARIDRP
jgi:hypothetical protein